MLNSKRLHNNTYCYDDNDYRQQIRCHPVAANVSGQPNQVSYWRSRALVIIINSFVNYRPIWTGSFVAHTQLDIKLYRKRKIDFYFISCSYHETSKQSMTGAQVLLNYNTYSLLYFIIYHYYIIYYQNVHYPYMAYTGTRARTHKHINCVFQNQLPHICLPIRRFWWCNNWE